MEFVIDECSASPWSAQPLERVASTWTASPWPLQEMDNSEVQIAVTNDGFVLSSVPYNRAKTCENSMTSYTGNV